MSRSFSLRLCSAVAAVVLALPAAAFAEGQCGQPISSGLSPRVTDCLYTLQTSVKLRQCELCVCDLDGDGRVVTTDAYICLRAAVGLATELACPTCPTTTLPPTTSTTSTTTTTIGPTTTTLPQATCGDGALDSGEACDDGNNTSGDGCSAGCVVEDSRGLCAGIDERPGASLASVEVATGLNRPVDLGAPPLDTRRLFVLEQEGRIRIIKDGVLSPKVFLDINTKVSCCGERGLLGIAFDPDYRSNRRFFLHYTDNAGAGVIARYRTSASDPDLADPASERVLFTVAQPFANHNGGQIAFGPDGMLYVGFGDGGSAGDPQEKGQDPTSVLGKMLRLDVDTDAAPYYLVPPDNPAAGTPDLLGLVWASGLRNPWRFSFDHATGLVYIADVGQQRREEINVVPAAPAAAYNFGWDIFEGTACFDPSPLYPDCASAPAGFTDPAFEYDHGQGCSVTGGYVYRGCAAAALRGTYLYADYCNNWVRAFDFDAGTVSNTRDLTSQLDPPGNASIASISTFGRDARGELYIADHLGGAVYKVVPAD